MGSASLELYNDLYILMEGSMASGQYINGQDASEWMTADVTWTDPMEDILSMLRELTFRLAVTSSSNGFLLPSLNATHFVEPTAHDSLIFSPDLSTSNRTVQQRAPASMTYVEPAYEIRPEWLAGSFVLIVLACLAILATYWGWWHLGRPVSLSPLEIAKAFDAPIMHAADPNATADELVEAVGDVRVRYGSAQVLPSQEAGETYEWSLIHCVETIPASPETHATDAASLQGTTSMSHSGVSGDANSTLEAEGDNRSDLGAASSDMVGTTATSLDNGNVALPVFGAGFTVAQGLISTTAYVMPAAPSLLSRQVRQLSRRPSLKFREERDEGIL